MTVLRYRALLVGNWHFPQDPANLPDLHGPPNDVAGLARALTTGPGCLFRPADVTTVTERPSYEICEAIEDFLDQATRHDALLLYYSGHGFTDSSGILRLTGRNSRLQQVSNTLGADEVSRMIRRSPAAVVIVVLDCCHAGAFKGGELAPQLATGRGRFVLAASQSRESAADAEAAGGFSRFTGHLLRGIQGEAAQPGADYITVTDVYQHVIRRMSAEGTIRPQRQFDGEGDPPLARAPATVPGEPAPAVTATTARDSAPTTAVASGRAPAAVVGEYRDVVPGLQVEPGSRSRLERTVRKLGGVSDRERTLALVGLPGGGAVLFTDPALYWLAKDRGSTVTAVSYRDLPGRQVRAVAAVPGRPATHVDLGDGVARHAGAAAQGLTSLLTALGRLRS